jgi:hypothetical protein
VADGVSTPGGAIGFAMQRGWTVGVCSWIELVVATGSLSAMAR